MRIMLILISLAFALVIKAQSIVPGSFMDYSYRGLTALNLQVKDSSAKKKWSFSKYTGLSASYSFFRGGSASVVAAPMGLQLNRQLTNNLYAFAGVMVAPAYINFNSPFLSSEFAKGNGGNSFLRSNSFGMY